jgi:hypothetical protein
LFPLKRRTGGINFIKIAENTIDRKWKSVVFMGGKWELCGTEWYPGGVNDRFITNR